MLRLQNALSRVLHLKHDSDQDTLGSPYQPLDEQGQEIRLLRVEAGTGAKHPLICTLQSVSLLDRPAPVYETISYHWGNASKRASITLNSYKRTIPATAAAALYRMRLPDTHRMLWIDSVCINQDDSIERGHQVALMGTVYSLTFRNLIWLGEDDQTTSKALRTINNILINAREETNGFENYQELCWDILAPPARPSQFDWDFDPQPLHIFYSRPWFQRLWVVQEAALAPRSTCFCGDSEIPLLDIIRATAWNHRHRFFSKHDLWSEGVQYAHFLFQVIHGREIFNTTTGPQLLYSLLFRLRDCKTSDPRDHVFALLGLYQNIMGNTASIPDLLRPYYSKPLAQVLRHVARFFVAEEGSLFFLAFNQRFDPTLPSWVPAWHVALDTRDGTHPLSFFYADNGHPTDRGRVLSLHDADTLLCPGITVGIVSGTSWSLRNGSHPPALLLKEIDVWAERIQEENPAKVVGQTLIAGTNWKYKYATDKEICDYSVWSRYVARNGKFPPPLQTLGTSGTQFLKAARYHHAFSHASHNRRLFATRCQAVGLGPKDMAIGDIVVVLYGSEWPVILRKHAGEHRIVGLAYVHGIMDGEAVRKHKAEGKEDEQFVIR